MQGLQISGTFCLFKKFVLKMFSFRAAPRPPLPCGPLLVPPPPPRLGPLSLPVPGQAVHSILGRDSSKARGQQGGQRHRGGQGGGGGGEEGAGGGGAPGTYACFLT